MLFSFDKEVLFNVNEVSTATLVYQKENVSLQLTVVFVHSLVSFGPYGTGVLE
jgi:hypothetical protein